MIGQRRALVLGRKREVGDADHVVGKLGDEQYAGLFASRKRDAAHGERFVARQQADAVGAAVVVDGAAETGVHARHFTQLPGDEASGHASGHAVQFLKGHDVGGRAVDDLRHAAEILNIVDAAAVADVVTHKFQGRLPLRAGAQQQAAHGGRQENAQKGFHVGKVNFPQR